MQAIFEVPLVCTDEQMARIDDVALQVSRLQERVDNHIRFFWVAVAGGFLWLAGISSALFLINGKINQFPASLSTRLIKESKNQALSGHLDAARTSLLLGSRVLSVAAEDRSIPPSGYFQGMLASLRSFPEPSLLSHEIHSATVQLADYKSAIERPPLLRGKQLQSNPHIRPADRQIVDPSFFSGGTVLVMIGPDTEFFQPLPIRKLAESPFIESMALVGKAPGVYQTLDGFHWISIAFANVRIVYEGTEVELRDVHFYNCTFQIAEGERGEKILDYVLSHVERVRLAQPQPPSRP